MQLEAAIANAVRALEWQNTQIHGDKKAKGIPAPVPFRPPWAVTEDDDEDGPQQGPIDESAEAGTRRFGRARMTTDEVDAWLGWAPPRTDN